MQERAQYKDSEGVKPWDRKLILLIAVIGPLAMIIVAGLDKRFGWSTPMSLVISLAALVVAVLALAFSTWALVENRFFSAVVRIQTDRGHSVCSTGPYHVVRHPGYAGGILFYLMTPLILSSWWAFIPALFTTIFTIIRTHLEDKTLQAELDGYRAYTHQTRYRLLPGVW